MRWVMARVLPVPAPASTQIGAPKLRAASRCSGSSASSSDSASAGGTGTGAAGAGWSDITVHPARTVRPPADGCGRRVPHTTGGAGAGAGSPLGGAPEPVVDQRAGHRGGAGRRVTLGLEGGGEVRPGEAARVGDLVRLEGELGGVRRAGAVSVHEGAWEGRGLAAHALGALVGEPDLLGGVAGDRVLEAL